MQLIDLPGEQYPALATALNIDLVTMHRAENVDDPPACLAMLIDGLTQVGRKYQQPVIVSVHQRTANRITRSAIQIDESVLWTFKPFGFFDFIQPEKSARCVISDSGTVQEECTIFGIPSVTVRDVTERAETIEVGGNMLGGANPADLLRAVATVPTRQMTGPRPEYLEKNVSRTVTKVVLWI